MRSRLPIIGISFLFALLTLIPYGLAYAGAGEFRFVGFLFNPYDAASYLAKMRQGYDGQILYTLAFTEDPGPGALFFTYYLLLGHLARILSVSLIAIWHAARIFGAAIFLIIAWEFFGRIGLGARGRAIAWIILLLGSGFGFLVIPLGTYTADLWVAEYIPFLGMLTSAHFPLATGLILLLAMRIALPARGPTACSAAAAFFLGTAIAAIQPFGILPLGLAIAVWAVCIRISQGRFPEGVVIHLAAAGVGFLPWAIYDFWVTQTIPNFASWFVQNQTPTPPVWDIALSLGLPGVIVSISFARWMLNRADFREKVRSIPMETLLLGLWLAINLALLYAPFSLQRRLMLGMWIPLAALAAPKLEDWLNQPAFRSRRAWYAGIPLIASNIVFLSAIRINALSHNPLLFLNRDAAAAVEWLATNARGSVVLASPENSAWLPGMAGVRVVYGHGMETPNADRALQDVEAFFKPTDADTQLQILANHQVNWVLCSAQEPACSAPEGGRLEEVFTSGNMKILAVRKK
jgi:hypothetical protein